MRESSSKLDSNKEIRLPIPNKVIGTNRLILIYEWYCAYKVTDLIEKGRLIAIAGIIASIDTIIREYNTGAIRCKTTNQLVMDANLACDGLVLGTLMKGISGLSLWPLPTAPYEGISVERLAKQVRNLKILALCENNRFYGNTFSNAPVPGHGVMKRLRDKADKFESGAKGLDIEAQPVTRASWNSV